MMMLNIADLASTHSAMAQAQAAWEQLKREQEQLIQALTPLAARLPRSILLGPEREPEVRMVATCRDMDMDIVPDPAKPKRRIGF